MEEKLCPEFERDDYIERLMVLRQTDPISYGVLPEAVKQVVEIYQREKLAIGANGNGSE